MRDSFTFEEPAVPLSFRLPLLIVALLLLALGLLGLVRGSAILIGSLGGETPRPTHSVIGWLVTAAATGLGLAMIRPGFIPDRKVVFDASAQEVRVAEKYPFGIRRKAVFALTDVRPPEIVWHKDQEYSDGGYWELKVILPDGRTIRRASGDARPSKQREQAEAWLEEILRMYR